MKKMAEQVRIQCINKTNRLNLQERIRNGGVNADGIRRRFIGIARVPFVVKNGL